MSVTPHPPVLFLQSGYSRLLNQKTNKMRIKGKFLKVTSLSGNFKNENETQYRGLLFIFKNKTFSAIAAGKAIQVLSSLNEGDEIMVEVEENPEGGVFFTLVGLSYERPTFEEFLNLLED